MRVPQVPRAQDVKQLRDEAFLQAVAGGKELGTAIGKAVAQHAIANLLSPEMIDAMVVETLAPIIRDLQSASFPEDIKNHLINEIRLATTTEIIRQLEILDDGTVSVGGLSR